MCRLLTGVYVMPARLSTLERKKSSNAHILTFGPHRFDFNNVLNYLQNSLKALDYNNMLKINR